MSAPVDVTLFPKKCPHGTPLRHVESFAGFGWWKAEDCAACAEAEASEDAANEEESDALIERMKARKKP